jgi:uncharacterized repeat protein (TIGR03803 family)
MKTCIKRSFLLPVLVAALGLLLGGRVTAQPLSVLHSFNGSDGARPLARLISSDNMLYGTTQLGGSGGNGTVFVVNTDGTGFKNLHSFSAVSGPNFTNDDGSNPLAGLTLLSNTLYGTTSSGGSFGRGTLFSVNTDGTGFRNLHTFSETSGPNSTNSDGAGPAANLILAGNTLYGTAGFGGTGGNGALFAVNTEGTGFTNFYSFTAYTSPNYTNSDGAEVLGSLTISNNTLYGMGEGGGGNGWGTVFRVNTDGTGFTNLHNFNPPGVVGIAFHFEGLVLLGSSLYGTKTIDGSTGYGTVFRLNTDGTGFTNLHSFTVNEGATPYGGLVLFNNTLYGTAFYGGSGSGTIFALNTDGTGFTNLYSFTASAGSFPDVTNNDGANPQSGLTPSGKTLYGTTSYGGIWGNGTVFGISSPSSTRPQLTIASSGSFVVLTWPTNATAYTLQTTTNLLTPIWTTNLPAPVVVNGQNTITNSISGTQQFFRLSQ